MRAKTLYDKLWDEHLVKENPDGSTRWPGDRGASGVLSPIAPGRYRSAWRSQPALLVWRGFTSTAGRTVAPGQSTAPRRLGPSRPQALTKHAGVRLRPFGPGGGQPHANPIRAELLSAPNPR